MTGRLLLNVLAMVAEFEAGLIRAHTREAMKVAEAKRRLRGTDQAMELAVARRRIRQLETGLAVSRKSTRSSWIRSSPQKPLPGD